MIPHPIFGDITPGCIVVDTLGEIPLSLSELEDVVTTSEGDFTVVARNGCLLLLQSKDSK